MSSCLKKKQNTVETWKQGLVPVEEDALERHPADGDGVRVGAAVETLSVDALRQAKVGDFDHHVFVDQAIARKEKPNHPSVISMILLLNL